MVERFNGRISDIVNQTRFASAAELDDTLAHYLSTYNHLIPQRALKHQSPIQALQKWRSERPQLFVKQVNNQPGLDRYCGDVLFPSLALNQIVELADAGLLFAPNFTTKQKFQCKRPAIPS